MLMFFHIIHWLSTGTIAMANAAHVHIIICGQCIPDRNEPCSIHFFYHLVFKALGQKALTVTKQACLDFHTHWKCLSSHWVGFP